MSLTRQSTQSSKMAFQELYPANTKSTPSFQPLGYQPPVTPVEPVKQTFGNKVLQTGKNIFSALTTAPAPKSLDMQQALGSGWDTISSTVQDTAKRLEKLPSIFTNQTTPLQKGVITGEALLGLVNDAFLGVSVPLNAARGVPVVGYAADAVNNLFAALGTGGGDLAIGAVDSLPFSENTKDTIRPLAQEVGALLAQIAAGKVGGDITVKLKSKSVELTNAVQKGVEEAKTNPLPVSDKPTPSFEPIGKTPSQLHSEYAKSQGYEPYKAPGDLPVIEAGAKPKSDLPTIQADAPKSNKLGDFTIEPIKQTQADLTSSIVSLESSINKGDTVATQTQLKDVQTKIEDLTKQVTASTEGISKIGKSIEAKAIEQQLTNGFDQTATFDKTTFKVQTEKVATLVNEGRDAILSTVRGEKPLPSDVQPAAYIAGVEAYLKKNPDIALLQELAKSDLVSRVSSQAQGLGLARLREQDSATAKLQAIRQAREVRTKTTPERASATRKATKESTNKVNLSEKDLGRLEKFIDNITC